MKQSSGGLQVVLGIGLSGFVVYIFDKIWGSQIAWEEVRKIDLVSWLFAPIPLVYFLAFVALALVLIAGFRKVTAKKPTYTKVQRQLMTYTGEKIPAENIELRWQVEFGDFGKPFVYDLSAWCTKHGEQALRYRSSGWNYECTMCGGLITNDQMSDLKNRIESALINRQQQLEGN